MHVKIAEQIKSLLKLKTCPLLEEPAEVQFAFLCALILTSVTWVAILSYFLQFYYFLEKQYLMIKRAKFQTILVTRATVIHVLIK